MRNQIKSLSFAKAVDFTGEEIFVNYKTPRLRFWVSVKIFTKMKNKLYLVTVNQSVRWKFLEKIIFSQ